LLVTGSRSLGDDPAAAKWAREQIGAAVFVLPDDAVIVTGDAKGPDTWAQNAAAALRMLLAVYRLDGSVVLYGDGEQPVHRWTEEAPTRDRRWPLLRNEAMVRAVAERVRVDGYTAECLALVDAASRTRGTRHTVTLCERAGIATRVVEWSR
jgi:phosphoserine phosphatase